MIKSVGLCKVWELEYVKSVRQWWTGWVEFIIFDYLNKSNERVTESYGVVTSGNRVVTGEWMGMGMGVSIWKY